MLGPSQPLQPELLLTEPDLPCLPNEKLPGVLPRGGHPLAAAAELSGLLVTPTAMFCTCTHAGVCVRQ